MIKKSNVKEQRFYYNDEDLPGEPNDKMEDYDVEDDIYNDDEIPFRGFVKDEKDDFEDIDDDSPREFSEHDIEDENEEEGEAFMKEEKVKWHWKKDPKKEREYTKIDKEFDKFDDVASEILRLKEFFELNCQDDYNIDKELKMFQKLFDELLTLRQNLVDKIYVTGELAYEEMEANEE